MKPRLFVSAVTTELGKTRQLVAHVLMRLGYDPVLQDIFGTEPGDLRQMLRDKIDDCDGLIQIVGRAYGAEPPDVDPEFGRCSYTQFEFLYAQSRGKKTWLIFADDGCTHDRPLEQLDLPPDQSSHVALKPDAPAKDSSSVPFAGASGFNANASNAVPPDAAAYQAERRALQEAWRQRWKDEEGHLHHGAASDTELELKVERLKDEFTQLRRAFLSWQRNVTRNLAVVALLLMLVGGGVWWTVYRMEAVAQQLAELKPELIREQLSKTIEVTYQRDLAEAEALKDWQKRDDARKAAADSRDRRLSQVFEFLESITATIQAGDASPEFLELTRIVREQGVEEALDYVASQQSRLLDRAASLVAQQRRETRRTLAPLLEGVRLHRTRGELQQADELCGKLLAADANWPETLHEQFRTQIELGDRALLYETISIAKSRFGSAHASAEHLVELAGDNLVWQRDLSISYERLGDVLRLSGQVTEAVGQFQEALKISQKLASAAPSDARAQRDLSISYERLGDVLLQYGQVTEALGQHQKGLAIRQKLAAANPSDAQPQNDLSISYNNLGDVSRQAGNLDEALEYYTKGLAIRQKLASADSNNAEAQRDLSISYNNLGDVSRQAGNLDEALEYYTKGLAIRQKLASADSNNVETRRDLSVSYERLGDVSRQADKLDEALAYYTKDMEISQKLALADPNNAQAQRDLSISYNKLGDVSRQARKMDKAMDYFANGLAISQELASADPNNVQAQRDLSVSYNRLGGVSLQVGKLDEALEYSTKDLAITLKLASADPNNAEAQRDLSISYNRLGDVSLQVGKRDKALEYYTKGLVIRQKLASADPTNAADQIDLAASFVSLGFVEQTQNQYEQAIETFGRGLKVLQSLKEQKRLPPVNEKWIGIVEKATAECQAAMVATGDWNKLLEADAQRLPMLLSVRAAEFAKRGRLSDVAQAVARLRQLEPKTKNNLYNAACGYALCAAGLLKDKPEPTDAEKQQRQQFIDLALTCLKEAIAAGFDDIKHMRQDSDLTVLRDLPEFKALIPETIDE